MPKYEFLSPEWIGMARERIQEQLASHDLSGMNYTLCEEFTNPPSHLRHPSAATIGFCMRVSGGEVEVIDHPVDDADLRIVSDYEDALKVARNPEANATDPAEMARRITSGRLRIEGDPQAAPPILRDLDIHRLLAARTA